MFIVLKKIVAKPLQTAAIPPQNRGAEISGGFRSRFHLYCINKSKITTNQMCHFLIDGAKVRQKNKSNRHCTDHCHNQCQYRASCSHESQRGVN